MTHPTPSSRSTHIRRWSRAACRATPGGARSSGRSSRTAPARCDSWRAAARGSEPRGGSPRHRLVDDALDERVVLEARFRRRFGHFVLGGDERIGVYLEHIDLVVVCHANVDTAVVLQPQRMERRTADLADPLRERLGDAFREDILDLASLAVLLVPLRLVGRDAVLRSGLRLAKGHFGEWQDFRVGIPDQAHVELPPFDWHLDDRVLVEFLVYEFT